MIRYRLDDLGWFAFEKLIQALLRSEIGLELECWGGHGGDLGRDAYAAGTIAFPERANPAPGPFIFQAKFIEGANSAGANSFPRVKSAVSAEITAIRHRVRNRNWQDPKHYVLITNASLNAAQRITIMELLKKSIPDADVVVWDGTDVCASLDNHPQLRRSFPEILSLRDLDVLLGDVVNAEIIERSKAALDEVRSIVRVFVPTFAYRRAWEVLHRHAFVVLDGPPEMGKTAIARMIALAQLSHGWEAIECERPADFFQVIDSQRQQIFISDDAFGRTEYDVTRGRAWERDLAKILYRLDRNHWLIWTTRRHILQRALRDLDLQGRAQDFPEPGEVTVSADNLSIEEKARMLYRHARAANPTEGRRQLIKDYALQIVHHIHFTPERIRRFVFERLPSLPDRLISEPVKKLRILGEINEAIKDPTKRMRLAFRKLPAEHKWMLISLLECDGPSPLTQVRDGYKRLRGYVSPDIFMETLDDLLGTFVRQAGTSGSSAEQVIDWIHPSYRDLVIEELARDEATQYAFLRRMSLNGLKLSLSVAGGSSGMRTFSLLTATKSWRIVRKWCASVVGSAEDAVVSSLLEILVSSESSPSPNDTRTGKRIRDLVGWSAKGICERWDREGRILDERALEVYDGVIRMLGREAPKPDMRLTLATVSSAIDQALTSSSALDPNTVEHWTQAGNFIAKHCPALLQEPEQIALQRALASGLISKIEEEMEGDLISDEPDELNGEAERLDALAQSVKAAPKELQLDLATVGPMVHRLEAQAERYRDECYTGEPDDYSSFGDGGGQAADVSIGEMFSDL